MKTLQQIVKSGKRAIASLALAATMFLPAQVSGAGEFNVGFNGGFGIGGGSSKLDVTPYENWERNFVPAGGSMKIDYQRSNGFMEIPFSFRPNYSWDDDSWEIGLPIFYQINFMEFNDPEKNFFFSRKNLASSVADWWDPVAVTSIELERPTPGVGVYLRKDNVALQYSMQEYKLSRVDCKGVDNWGSINESKPFRKETLEEGKSSRLDALFFFNREEAGDAGIGIFYEKCGSDSWLSGIYLQLGTPKLFK